MAKESVMSICSMCGITLLAGALVMPACGGSPSSTATSSSTASSGSASSAPKFLSFDASAKTATILLHATYNTKALRNFNGYSKGGMTISVPVGWKITVKCINADVSGEYHSCAVVADEHTVTPVFTGATTPNPLNALGLGQTATFSFSPDTGGNDRFACLVG